MLVVRMALPDPEKVKKDLLSWGIAILTLIGVAKLIAHELGFTR
jgi:hypothetical protein